MHFACDNSSLLNECLQYEAESTICSSIFDKYKLGGALPNAPFRLFDGCAVGGWGEESEEGEGRGKVRGPYRKYSCQEKQEAVERIQNGEDVKVVSREYGIPRRNLLRWKKHGCERKEGGGRPTDEEMESVVYAKIKSGELTDEKQIRQLAIALSKLDSFKASKGWFVKFCQRFDLRLSPTPASTPHSLPLPDPDTHSSPCL